MTLFPWNLLKFFDLALLEAIKAILFNLYLGVVLTNIFFSFSLEVADLTFDLIQSLLLILW